MEGDLSYRLGPIDGGKKKGERGDDLWRQEKEKIEGGRGEGVHSFGMFTRKKNQPILPAVKRAPFHVLNKM